MARLFQAPGWAAKMSVVALGLMGVLGIAAWRLGDHPSYEIAIVLIASFDFIAFVIASAVIVQKFPSLQLEGQDLRKHLKSTPEPARPAPTVTAAEAEVPDDPDEEDKN